MEIDRVQTSQDPKASLLPKSHCANRKLWAFGRLDQRPKAAIGKDAQLHPLWHIFDQTCHKRRTLLSHIINIYQHQHSSKSINKKSTVSIRQKNYIIIRHCLEAHAIVFRFFSVCRIGGCKPSGGQWAALGTVQQASKKLRFSLASRYPAGLNTSNCETAQKAVQESCSPGSSARQDIQLHAAIEAISAFIARPAPPNGKAQNPTDVTNDQSIKNCCILFSCRPTSSGNRRSNN